MQVILISGFLIGSNEHHGAGMHPYDLLSMAARCVVTIPAGG